ncbi:ATP-binding cassette domain-containing protein [Thaumasiovibrio subtropicus]|uniref:ATP-binding cassette domain-containing protein n=1 Tax=Thaumasiovibrio subtropicus TaxID=1891207 RepID=UPI001C858385|nr:ATP-binding cassette domain-containing protein [Thaumasiovibrio subtropicus]
MPKLQFSQLSFQLADGEPLFSGLSASLPHGITALVGDNGAGKSVLARCLMGLLPPDSGHIQCTPSVGYLSQQEAAHAERPSTASIGRYLGLEEKLKALQRISQGEYREADFTLVGDDWLLEEQLHQRLRQAGLPANWQHHCDCLSGGERVRLRLLALLEEAPSLLVLDEPTNHLDVTGRKWLAEALNAYQGDVLVISHDVGLLALATQVWKLDTLGLHLFEGSYQAFVDAETLKIAALERQYQHTLRLEKCIIEEARRSEEKAQRRARQGEAARQRGDQPKILLNSMRNSAQSSAQSRRTQTQAQLQRVKAERAVLDSQRIEHATQTLYFAEAQAKRQRLRVLEEVVLPYGNATPLSMQLFSGDRWHLCGANGSGKSTLLKCLMGWQRPKHGYIKGSAPLAYLDQHYSLLHPDESMLDNLRRLAPHLDQSAARTLLAGIGFRRDSVFRLTRDLSGGEKMKLAVVAISQQADVKMLLLDEPDNHLDLRSKQLLIHTLNQYPGGFVLVSHDEGFVDALSIEKH